MSSLVVERTNLPATFLEWLEEDEKKTGVLLYREEDGQVVLERLENVDLTMLARVRANIERYHSALERLADS
jgi:hypothetical protein